MQLFYTQNFSDDKCILSADESIHCKNVLRKKAGDTILVTNGKGDIYTCSIIAYHSKECLLSVDALLSHKDKHDYNLHVAIAPTKNLDRVEWFLEKAVEVGIDEITPIICERSERKIIRQDRLEKIAASAMKQSTNVYMPTVNEAISFNKFLEQSFSADKFIAHCVDGEKQLLKNSIINNNILMLIGPEGDFSLNEIENCLTKGFKPVSLGDSRLRTETAALASCFTVSLHYM